jgi:hypothetical protein
MAAAASQTITDLVNRVEALEKQLALKEGEQHEQG